MERLKVDNQTAVPGDVGRYWIRHGALLVGCNSVIGKR